MNYLDNHEAFSSSDLDEVRSFLNSAYAPHDFALKGEGARVNARICGVQFGALNLVHLTFGNVDIRVTSPEGNGDGLMFYVITDGAGYVRHGAKEMEASKTKGFVRDTAAPVDARQKGLGTFMIPLDKKRLKAHARALAGEEVDLHELRFDHNIDFTAPGAAVVRSTVLYIADASNGPLRTLKAPILETQFEDLLLTQLLTLLPNSYQDLLNGGSRASVVPRHVKSARDYIHANANRKIALADMAAAAGCSYRALQRGFMDAYGVSPTAYLRTVRLRRIRAMLLAGQGAATIGDLARELGFAHAGRFSQAYYREFGEHPSETLRYRS